MIEYSPKHEEEKDSVSEGTVILGKSLDNPFPGLRTFGINESHLFFGREGHVDQILSKLTRDRFISVLGYSGSGKSSLMYCGLIPTLYGGFMANAGPDWTVITTRPGNTPFNNLAKSILKSNDNFETKDPETENLRTLAIESILKSGDDGLLRAVNYFKKPVSQNYLIFIDQFEELIRYKNDFEIEGASENAFRFVELITQSLKRTDSSIYFAITMRSEFLGECSAFRSLTEYINHSNFLVPRLSLQNKRDVIEGPVSVAQGAISKRLVNRLVEEVGDNQDQLPILQHALMRTWNYWKENRDEKEAIDLRHYNAIGKMSGALSQHADEIFEELTPKQKLIAETLFKLLTYKGADAIGLRRPAKLLNVASLAGVSEDDVIEVIDAFRKPERSFLMPAHGVPLHKDSYIEISHESLMRIWVRLKNWVDEEYESAQMYLRLSEAAEMYQIGKTGLWRPPDLQLALNWQKKQRPNLVWARRYNEAFERTIVFLDTSKVTYEAEQKSQEMQQKRLLRRTRAAAIFLAIAFVIAIVFFVFGVIQKNNAEAKALLAVQNEELAKDNAEEAIDARVEADKARENAENQRMLAEQSALELQNALSQIQQANNSLLSAIQRESVAREMARIERDRAIEQSVIAERKSREADSVSQINNKNFRQAQRLLYLQIAQSMSAKSVNIEDDNLKGLLAYQAYIFNKEFEGRKYDPYIYNGLHATLAAIDGKTYNTISLHRNSVRSVAFPNSTDVFYSTGADGKVIKNVLSTKESIVLSSGKYRNKIVSISPDAKWMASGGDSTFINVFKLSDQPEQTQKLTIHSSYINDIVFLPDNRRVVTSSGDNTIKLVNIKNGEVTEIASGSIEYKVVDVSPDGKSIVAGGIDGSVRIFDIKSKQETILKKPGRLPVYAVAYSPDKKWIAVGYEKGRAELWNAVNNTKSRDLISHSSRVSDLDFSDNGQMLATASLNGSVNIWVLDELNELPISLDDNDAYVWDVEFSPDSRFLLAACEDGEIRVWTTDTDDLVKNMCDKLERNLTLEEWEQYVGNELPFMFTCENQK